MKYNYHTHTSRCFHARGTDEEYVLAAIEAGFDGFRSFIKIDGEIIAKKVRLA